MESGPARIPAQASACVLRLPLLLCRIRRHVVVFGEFIARSVKTFPQNHGRVMPSAAAEEPGFDSQKAVLTPHDRVGSRFADGYSIIQHVGESLCFRRK